MNKIFFDTITSWQDKQFPQATPLSAAKHLRSEVEELIEELCKCQDKDVDYCDPKSEYADCILLIINSMHKLGIGWTEMWNIVAYKFSKNLCREWGDPNKEGWVEHVKDGQYLFGQSVPDSVETSMPIYTPFGRVTSNYYKEIENVIKKKRLSIGYVGIFSDGRIEVKDDGGLISIYKDFDELINRLNAI